MLPIKKGQTDGLRLGEARFSISHGSRRQVADPVENILILSVNRKFRSQAQVQNNNLCTALPVAKSTK